MSPLRASLKALLAAFTLFTATPASLGQSQAGAPGEVVWNQKISATSGNGPDQLKAGDQFGRGMQVIGDVDGDGVQDIAVGAPKDDDGGSSPSSNYGAVWILFMKADGSVRQSQKISSERGGLQADLDGGDEFGRSVGYLGDFDLDGTPDVLVGANYDDDGGSNRGAAYLLFLNPDGTVKDERKISDTEGDFTADLDTGDQLGRGLCSLGDLDGDGVTDLAIGASNDDDGGSNRGAIYVCFMNADGTVDSHTKISDTSGGLASTLTDSSTLGFDLANLGDLDGDGVVDLASGAPDNKTIGPEGGALFVMFLNTNGTVKSDVMITEGYGGFDGDLDDRDEFTACIGFLGDVDGDGVGDIAVGAGKDDDGLQSGSTNRGAIWILFMNTDGTVKGHQKISQTQGAFGATLNNGDRFGTSIGSPGDWNGDGIADIFVGARFDDDGGQDKGAVYLIYLNDGSITPVQAGFTGGPRSGPAPLSVDFTDLSSGDYTSWQWDFGDGETSTLANPTHVFTAEGDYSVTLSVGGLYGNDSKTFVDVIQVDAPLPPAADFSGAPTSGFAPLAVEFTDASVGLLDGWSWDFGDGATSTLQNPCHTYASPGTYDVTLTAIGPGGSNGQTRLGFVTVDPSASPTAEFTANKTGGSAPLVVHFTDLSSGDVSSWSWDFGDGVSSSLAEPTHTYSAAGLYTVSLTVTGSFGADTEDKLDYVLVDASGPPTAGFTGTPTSGSTPLVVSFTDSSSGLVDLWTWDFGDGSTSTLQDPVHTYMSTGLYTVSLTVLGPGGANTLVRTDYVDVSAAVSTGIADGSFESQAAGSAPAAPWTSLGGFEHVINPTAAASDNAMPTDGSQWLELSADGSIASLPPDSPGGETSPAVGGVGVSQTFTYATDQSLLKFEASFVLDGVQGSASANDWMSVDVGDGVRVQNVFFADTFSSFTRTSAKYGLPMTSIEKVVTDLRLLFPTSDETTVFSLTIQIGNAGDGSNPSKGFVDDVRLEESSVKPYGCGINPAGSLLVLGGSPTSGATLELGLDNPFGTQAAGSLPILAVTTAPDASYPCGTPINGWGMQSAGAAAELLIRINPVPFLTLTGPAWAGPGSPAQIDLPIPALPSFVGTKLYAQGRIVDSTPAAAIPLGLTEALEITVLP